MFEVFVKTHFSSAHFLRNYPGNCEHLHGHNWDVEVAVTARELNDIDVAIDFRDLKNIVKKIMARLDHKNLNELPEFSKKNPSSERLAEFIFHKVREELKAFPGVEATSVKVCETPSSGVIYRE
jgi:6-pyruvoyltetrahydropterin/6-carboxytetrahydropterin synthase